MKMSQKLMAGLLTISALLPLTMLPAPVYAQQLNKSQVTPRIEGFNVDEVRRLTPGVGLDFTIYGTSGGIATLRIAGATRYLELIEMGPGQYEGTYTISRRDKIAARSPVTANLRIGNQAASVILSESLQVGVGRHNENTMPGLQQKITRLNVGAESE